MTQKRILVADDDESVKRAITRMFEAMGHVVDSASSYIDVNELLESHVYDLIVCDNGMPLVANTRIDHTCGLQLLARAKTGGPNEKTPFILHTGDDREETKRLAEEFGGVYRYKSDTNPPLIDVVKKLLETGVVR